MDFFKATVVVRVQNQNDFLDGCCPWARQAQKVLGFELTRWCHSCQTEAALEGAQLEPDFFDLLDRKRIDDVFLPSLRTLVAILLEAAVLHQEVLEVEELVEGAERRNLKQGVGAVYVGPALA